MGSRSFALHKVGMQVRGYALLVGTLTLVALASADFTNVQRMLKNSIDSEAASGKLFSTLANDDIDPQFFSQTVDHFDDQLGETYKQRYFVNNKYWTQAGPVFLYIGGEAALSQGAANGGQVAQLAEQYGGLVVALEHRYYGISHPFKDMNLTSDRLKYLSSKQALADGANFIMTMHKTGYLEDHFSKDFEHDSSRKYISVGGSYPGNLSAWIRMKYPHLIIGSIASSAPVLAKADFFEYDQVVKNSLEESTDGEKCSAAVIDTTKKIEALLKDPKTADAVKEQFGCKDMGDDAATFLYVLADSIAFGVQYTSTDPKSTRYNMKDKLCANMTNADLDLVQAYADFVHFIYKASASSCDGMNMITTGSKTQVAEEDNMRQWLYQSCAEFGMFQTAPKENSLRSTEIDLAWHYRMCETLYDMKLTPNTDFTNAVYGGNRPSASKIVFTNGSLDPWRFLGVQETLKGSPTVTPIVIEGTSHCADLHGDVDSDPESLRAARAAEVSAVAGWLAGDESCPADCSGNGVCMSGSCYCSNGFTGDDCNNKGSDDKGNGEGVSFLTYGLTVGAAVVLTLALAAVIFVVLSRRKSASSIDMGGRYNSLID